MFYLIILQLITILILQMYLSSVNNNGQALAQQTLNQNKIINLFKTESAIKTAIENYIEINGNLPQNINDLKNSNSLLTNFNATYNNNDIIFNTSNNSVTFYYDLNNSNEKTLYLTHYSGRNNGLAPKDINSTGVSHEYSYSIETYTALNNIYK